MTDGTMRVLAHFEVVPDRVDEFKSLMAGVRDATRAEEGCVRYELQQSVDRPYLFVFVEEWRSEEDMAGHLATPHIRAIAPQLQSMLALPPRVDRYRAVG
ncbi:putative quinol monooxygenase [uncultured Sphingomonas sp.]|uniref:putative quinol monooxygenase n=1 Tax=uncultured Sphingomonas sp. TaxID=158754 RepID=UPI0035CAC1BF